MVFSSAHSLIGASLYFDINGPKQRKKLSVVVNINQDQVPFTFYLKLREFMFKILCMYHFTGYTFAETNARVNQVARALKKLDVQPGGDGVAIFMKNKPEFLFSYYGIYMYIPAI